MGFGPWISDEEKRKLNTNMRTFQQKQAGMVQGVGERVTPQEIERRRRASSPEAMSQEAENPQRNFGVERWWREARESASRGARTGGAGAMMSGGDPGKVYPTEAVMRTIKPSRDYQKDPKKETETKTKPVPETTNPPRPTGGDDPRNVTVTNANGVVQTGTQTGPKPMTMDDANSLLSGGFTVQDPYSSNQLPTTASSPYKGIGGAQLYNPDDLNKLTSDVDQIQLTRDLFGGKSGVEAVKPGNNLSGMPVAMDAYGPGKTPENYSVGDLPTKSGGSTESGQTDWLNRSAMDNSDERVRRRAAMLDDYNGADGNPVRLTERMQNQEAIQGRKYAGGKHWQVNKNAGQEGEDDFVQISAGQSRARSNYTKTADEVFANHLGKAKETVASSETPDLPDKSEPMLPGALPGDTPMDKSPFDTQDLMQMQPGKSIIGDDKPYSSVKPGTLFR